MKHRARHLVWIIGSLLVLLSGVVVGTALARPSGQTPIQQALGNTYKAGTNHFDMSLTVGVSGKTQKVAAKGAFDFRHNRGYFKVDTGTLLASVKIGNSPLPRSLDMVVVGSVLYIHLPALKTQNPGKEWLKVDPKTLPKSTTGGADIGSLVSALNPLKSLTILGGATSVHALGTQRIGGVPMARYRAVIDTAKLAQSVSPSQRAQIRALLKQMGLTTISMDTWVDRSGYVRRIATLPLSLKTSQTAAAALQLTMNFSAYGSTVTVSAPPAPKCLDVGAMLAQLGSGSGG